MAEQKKSGSTTTIGLTTGVKAPKLTEDGTAIQSAAQHTAVQ